jgi:hypothetical protein
MSYGIRHLCENALGPEFHESPNFLGVNFKEDMFNN